MRAAASSDPRQKAKKARMSVALGACFRDVVNFNLVEEDETLEEVKWTRALEMWMLVIMEDPGCSAIGRKNQQQARCRSPQVPS